MTKTQVLALIRKAVSAAGNQARWAEAQGVSPAYISMVLSGDKDPSPKLCAAVGVERVSIPASKTYRRIKQ